MNSSGDAAEQLVRLSLEGFEVVAKVSGEAAKNIALLLISALKQEQKTKGKARLTNMIKSGKELKVYTIQQKDLKEFTKHAKKYGVLYTVLRDRNNKDKSSAVDIIARADDASKIQRIIDRFDLATVDKGSIVTQSEKSIEERRKKAEGKPEKAENDALFNELFDDDAKEKSSESEHKPAERESPFTSRTEKSPPSGKSSTRESTLSDEGTVVKDKKKPSVKKKLEEYRRRSKQQKEQDKDTPVKEEKPKAQEKPAVTEHKQPTKAKNKKTKER